MKVAIMESHGFRLFFSLSCIDIPLPYTLLPSLSVMATASFPLKHDESLQPAVGEPVAVAAAREDAQPAVPAVPAFTHCPQQRTSDPSPSV